MLCRSAGQIKVERPRWSSASTVLGGGARLRQHQFSDDDGTHGPLASQVAVADMEACPPAQLWSSASSQLTLNSDVSRWYHY